VRIAGHALIGAGDTKAGTLIGHDKYGNKFFENLQEELPCKRMTREMEGPL